MAPKRDPTLKDNKNKQPSTDICVSKTSTADNANHDVYLSLPLCRHGSEIDKAFNRIQVLLDQKLTMLSDSVEKLVSDARALGNRVKSLEESLACHRETLGL